MKFTLLFSSLFIVAAATAQVVGYHKDSVTTVIVHKDPRFDEMAAMQSEINKHAANTGPRRTTGFRVQAANTQNRDEANAVKAELLSRFPNEKCYLLYQSPNFRVRIGNFLTQKDAFQLRKSISVLYPNKGVYIVPDMIDYTPPAGEVETSDK